MNRQNWILTLGAFCTLSGVIAACGPTGPVVIPFQPPREPITGLDVVEEGETEISATFGGTVGVDQDRRLQLSPVDPYLLAAPWTVGLNHGLERIELRLLVGQHLLNHQGSLGVGYKLRSEGRWDVVADAALAASRYQSRFEVPDPDYVDTANGETTPGSASTNPSFTSREPGWYAYAYWITAPSLRIRAVWKPSEQLSVPMAVRVAHSRTGFGYGLFDFEQEQQNYVELSAGVIWSFPETCLSVGGGVNATVYPFPSAMASASASCDVDWKGLRR